MLTDLEKEIIKVMKEHKLEKDTIIPTLLLLRNLEDYQKRLLEFLNKTTSLTEEDVILALERMGCLENNPNVL